MIRYKVDILAELRDRGITSWTIRRDRIMGQRTLQQIREGTIVSWETIDRLCRLLQCQPGDLVEYISDEDTT